MSTTSNIDAMIKEARRSHPATRWLVYDQLARDYGDGFAKVVKDRVEEMEKRRGRGKGNVSTGRS